MPQLFKPSTNGKTQMLLAAICALVLAGAAVAFMLNSSPYSTGESRIAQQPVPFSHQHHVGELGIQCGYCHTSFTRSPFAGMPDTATCMTCHSQLYTSADVLAPVRKSFTDEQPLAWVRVHDLPDHVYFSHQAHVNNGVGCESCHGRVDRMPLMRQAKPLSMRWCLECHRNPGPQLREISQITVMGIARATGSSAATQALLNKYDIHPKRMTDCMTCHR
ncbi:MAG: cytochrome c3 family protein [Halopseudomonas sp.]|uniref:cytochrome c3 family protein n=1 Tax=Halopseudomonas sp. TaxID=2901191 RepID=UPI0030035D3E